MIKIGNANIKTNIILAPLSGCTDLHFRLIAREHGAGFCFFEMSDSNSLTHNRRQSFSILETEKKDSPIAGQLLGSDPSHMLDAAGRILDRVKLSFLDINCACPVKKVIKKKAGAHLLRDTPQLYAILKKLIPNLPLPITIKVRIGYDKKDPRQLANMVKQCEDIGVAAIFAHGRLANQGYAGDVDYSMIKNIKEAVRIPVIGSGNIFSPELAKKMLDETACDGVLVARGALGNPWIFKQIDDYLKHGKLHKMVSLEEKKKVLKKHLSYVDKYRDMSNNGKTGFMKKIAIWYLKGVPGAPRLREKITSAKNYEEILATISSVN
ncbi:MAG: tRNA dihydrouridine synthase DusB [Candidatus Omnitrophota bacterium]|nr:tRNA dihydrouridine synthase DusB [Candidatus Omnitrophota bacterium]